MQPYWKDQLISFKQAVHWKTLFVVTIWFSLSYIIWGWFGLFISFLINWFMFRFNIGQGGFADKIEKFKTTKKTFYCDICKKEETVYLKEM